MAQEQKHWMTEADIGSGEKSAAQKEIEREERTLNGPDGTTDSGTSTQGRMLQSGTHLARIQARKMPDDTYEAQVYVRLTREPEAAETYIPAGTFPTEEEAWSAAEERAKRAFTENEF